MYAYTKKKKTKESNFFLILRKCDAQAHLEIHCRLKRKSKTKTTFFICAHFKINKCMSMSNIFTYIQTSIYNFQLACVQHSLSDYYPILQAKTQAQPLSFLLESSCSSVRQLLEIT